MTRAADGLSPYQGVSPGIQAPTDPGQPRLRHRTAEHHDLDQVLLYQRAISFHVPGGFGKSGLTIQATLQPVLVPTLHPAPAAAAGAVTTCVTGQNSPMAAFAPVAELSHQGLLALLHLSRHSRNVCFGSGHVPVCIHGGVSFGSNAGWPGIFFGSIRPVGSVRLVGLFSTYV